MQRSFRRWRSFGCDRNGSVALLFAASIFVIVLSVGLAIDGARAYNVSTRVVAALDAAALAGAKLLDNENASDDDIKDRARRFFAIHFERVPILGVHLDELVVTVDRNRGEVDVAVDVALDATFAQLAGISKFEFPRSTRVRYEQKYIELALVLDITGSMCMPCDKIEGLKAAAREVITNLVNPSVPYGYVKISIVPYAASVNAGEFAAAVSGGRSTDGCVVERSGSHNADDHIATGGNTLGVSNAAANARYHCAATTIMPLGADRASLVSKIDSLSAGGWTAGHIGLGWGWYTLSQRWEDFWTGEAKPRRRASNVVKAVLFMTDGEFNTSYIAGPGQNATDQAVSTSSADQTARLCANMKADDVLIYTVAFQSPASAESLLRACATSPGYAFTASSNQELFAAFRTIAERLSALRITL